MSPVPSVSVVVPTYRRPEQVERAVRSALAQTISDLEVVVVVDDCDAATVAVLEAVGDVRVRVVVPESHLGNAEARNTGIRAATGSWIALLDDDDLWLPAKLERQLAKAASMPHRYPIVSCGVIARSATRDFFWPRYVPSPGEPLSDYLFCRRRPITGDGLVQTSTLLTRAALFAAVPFRSGQRYVDQDWLLRACRVDGAAVAFAGMPEPLVVWHMEAERERISNHDDWRFSLDWIRARRDLVTPRAYAAFLLTLASASGARQGDRAAFAVLLLEAFRKGKPGLVEILGHVANFLVPGGFKQRLAGLASGLRRQSM